MTKKLKDNVTFRHGANVRNRIVQAPMQSFSGGEEGVVTEETLEYYRAHSETAGLIITEFHYVSEEGGPSSKPGWGEQLAIYDDKHLPGLKMLAQAMKKDGNKAIIQLHHAGRSAYLRGARGQDVLVPSEHEYDYPLKEMIPADIQDVIKDFGRAVSRAIEAGFDGVEIHGANHYLIQQFFSKTTNQRQDEYGGSLENRMRFALEVTDAVTRIARTEGPEDFIVGYRLSPEEIHSQGAGYRADESQALVAALMEYELDYLHLSIFGDYNDGPQNSDQTYAELYREIMDRETKLILTGSIFGAEKAQKALDYTDLVAIGRQALIDPEIGKKINENREEEIVTEMNSKQLEQSKWPKDLFRAFDSSETSLPPMPGYSTIKDIDYRM